MIYNSTPSATIYVKVAISRRPYSNDMRAIRIVAAYGSNVNVNNAIFSEELPMSATSIQIHAAIVAMKQSANARDASVSVNKATEKCINRNDQYA